MIANMSARVGSIGDNSLGGWYSYRASKTALNQLTKTMAIECTRRKTNVSCIMLHPGTVDTDLSAPFQKVCSGYMVYLDGLVVYAKKGFDTGCMTAFVQDDISLIIAQA